MNNKIGKIVKGITKMTTQLKLEVEKQQKLKQKSIDTVINANKTKEASIISANLSYEAIKGTQLEKQDEFDSAIEEATQWLDVLPSIPSKSQG